MMRLCAGVWRWEQEKGWHNAAILLYWFRTAAWRCWLPKRTALRVALT